MKLKFTLFTFLLLLVFVANAQVTEDVVYLKNGWILHGKITNKTDTSVSIKTKDRNIFVFKTDEVLKITQETLPPDYNLKEKGYAHFTELGPLASQNTGELNVNTSAFSFQTVNGYKFKKWLFAGAGVGIDLYATQTFFPVFGSLRGDFISKKQFVPFYFMDFGYGINGTTKTQTDISYRGGAVFAGGLGLKIGLSKNAGVMISIGYRNQRYGATRNGRLIDDSYERIALRAGFYL